MIKKDLNKLNLLAKEVINNNQYITLATVGRDGKVWISPVAYCFDKNFNIYYASMPGSRHSLNIKHNNNIAVTIFDSHQKWGEGVGLQIEAMVRTLKFIEIPQAAKLYITRVYPYGGLNTKAVSSFIKSMITKGNLYNFYKIKPKQVWINNPYSKIDERVKIIL